MRKIVELDISISSDAFLAGPHDSHERRPGEGNDRLQPWIRPGSREINNADLAPGDTAAARGALVVGRRTYNLVDGWGRTDPFEGESVFVLTGAGLNEHPQDKPPFTYVAEGIASAVAQAIAAAGDENVYVIDGSHVAQKAINARQLDEIRVRLVPLLLGEGMRSFEQSSPESLELVPIKVM